MTFIAEHPVLVASLAVLILVVLGWRIARVAIRSVRAIVRAMWPH